MPTYDYLCQNCGYTFEHFQSISSEPIKTCPRCHQGRVQRKISGGSGLIFKGSGFYITDYARKNGQKSEVKSDTAADTPRETAKDSATESKTAQQAPSK